MCAVLGLELQKSLGEAEYHNYLDVENLMQDALSDHTGRTGNEILCRTLITHE